MTLNGDVACNPSIDRQIQEWCCYNFAARSFHTKKLCSRLYFFREKLNFTGTNSDIAFLCHPLRDLGVTYTVHLWLVGKRVVDFLVSYHDWGTMSRYWSKLRCLKRGGSPWTQISGRKGASPPTVFGIRELESLGYCMVKKCWKFQPAL